MSEPLIENSQQNIPVNPIDEEYSSINSENKESPNTYNRNQ